MKNVAATSGQSVRWADFLLELLAGELVACDAGLGVDNSYGFLLNHLDSVAAFNLRKFVRDARRICEKKSSPQRTQSVTGETLQTNTKISTHESMKSCDFRGSLAEILSRFLLCFPL